MTTINLYIFSAPFRVIKIHFHADSDGIVSAFFVSGELERLKVKHTLHPCLGSALRLKGKNNIALDISNVSGPKNNLAIDHHVSERLALYYANPRRAGFEWPVSFITYSLFGEPEQSWIAAVGVVADWGAEKVPRQFWEVVRTNYPGLVPTTNQKKLTHGRLGEMAEMVDSLVTLERSDGALTALKALRSARTWKGFHAGKGRAKKLKQARARVAKEVDRIFGRELVTKKFMLLRYSSKHRIKSMVAARAKDLYPRKMIVIAQDEGERVRLSFRNGDDLDKLVKRLTKGIGEGGGHPRASGGWIQADKWDLFRERLSKLIE